ncbi:MAG: hypothetical protein WC856_13630 [Methylococcaceae bacterium]|jgi:hypothetical protein
MIASICSELFDYAGDFLIHVQELESDLSHISRRVSRSATLDGGSIIVDNGYSASDATFTIVIRDIDNTTRLALIAMIKRHSAIIVSVKENVFSGVVEAIYDREQMKIRFLVSQQLNE